MAFGNPYGDDWNTELLLHWIDQLHLAGVRQITLADTVGIGQASHIGTALAIAIPAFQEVKFGLHLHTKSTDWRKKIDAAHQSGCRYYDGVLSGLGGCPMAGPDLVGNIHTRYLLDYFREKEVQTGVDQELFKRAEQVATEIIL